MPVLGEPLPVYDRRNGGITVYSRIRFFGSRPPSSRGDAGGELQWYIADWDDDGSANNHGDPQDRIYGVVAMSGIYLWHQLPTYRADSNGEEIGTPPQYVTGELPPVEHGTPDDREKAKKY